MGNDFEDVKKEVRKALPYLFPTISYIILSLGIGYFFVVYVGLAKPAWGTSIGISGFLGILDYLAGTKILHTIRVWWSKIPPQIHVWIVIDCLAYYFLF